MADYRSVSIDRLFKAISLLRGPEECAAFFDDICTITEICDMAHRLDAAILLRQGLNYQEISKELGISTTTINRVNRCIHYGSGGYRIALDRLQEEEKDEWSSITTC